jgi:FlaA1/EpsC-like NDP-sugar epimerase
MRYEWDARSQRGQQRRTLIYGAGAAGVMLLRESRSNRTFRHLVCGFVDDDTHKVGSTIQGVKVAGTGADLAAVVRTLMIDEVIIAIPTAAGHDMSRIIEHCNVAGVPFRTIPALSEMISARGITRQIRDVAVDDVLGRSVIQLDRGCIDAKLKGRVALVTGAAGSIGSEICRQIAACQPDALVLVDIAETPLFHIERELRQEHPQLNLQCEIASIQNVQRLNEIFARHRPRVVYHAAAYKHVPMMEANVFEAVENNVMGTYNVGVAASEYGVEDFVMISSDKAVRPTNIMGATKRVAELVIRSLQNGGPRYVSVRFGNVLGSNGSVVPIFKEQIASGGPVKVTHPDVCRYFMTIPEAVQLVLQASTMGRGGEIFVLDMGTPVKIVDLARQLILLSGLKPDEDI